jgi:hypothetical protein
MSSLAFAPISPNPSGDACFTTTDPQYASSGAPARMADGRIVTDYRPRCLQYPLKAVQMYGENGARSRMTNGAAELRSSVRDLNNQKLMPTSCEDTMVPELYKRVCTWQGCKTIPGNFQGIGVGRIYVPRAEESASDPQALSDITVPAIPETYPRTTSRAASQCAIDDPEVSWTLHGKASAFGGSAKSHPYSSPRA